MVVTDKKKYKSVSGFRKTEKNTVWVKGVSLGHKKLKLHSIMMWNTTE
jgi:hypothetical protein